MSANRAKHTGPELRVRKFLKTKRLKGFRLHFKNIPGKPDIAYPSKQLAIFINGCFWHRC
ncbi:MAG: very short patch repair endonuclease, partial [bacterium]|nr:very short patch repair endonuclease [bacterium]